LIIVRQDRFGGILFDSVLEFVLVAHPATVFQAPELISPSPQFLCNNVLHTHDLEVSLKQESRYEWPENDRQAMREFLEQEKRRTDYSRPTPIR
jgi:hypothetical protein